MKNLKTLKNIDLVNEFVSYNAPESFSKRLSGVKPSKVKKWRSGHMEIRGRISFILNQGQFIRQILATFLIFGFIFGLLVEFASAQDYNSGTAVSPYASRIYPPDPPNEGILFVDHSKNDRSGHLGHALVQYSPGKILAFYPNVSNDNKGHSAVGWMEYKRSLDGGKTWSKPQALGYSKKMFEGSGKQKSAFTEKAVLTDDGDIILFHLNCDISEGAGWRPHYNPTYTKSSDGGYTWSEPKTLGAKVARVYDAMNYEGNIYVLLFANDSETSFLGTSPDHIYQLFVSEDGGNSFEERSILPFNTIGRAYGTMEVLKSGEIIVYIQDMSNDPFGPLDYVTSSDNGRTWSEVKTTYFTKRIRNQQMIKYNNGFFMHGRAKGGHFVLYSSEDGKVWDEGTYLRMGEAGAGAYSNSIVVDSPDSVGKKRLLIQASHAYENNKTNVLHWWLQD